MIKEKSEISEKIVNMNSLLESTNELLESESKEKTETYEKLDNEATRANELFRLSYERRLKIKKLEDEIKQLKEKLDTAVKALETNINAIDLWIPKGGMNIDTPNNMKLKSLRIVAEEALEKIKELK